MARYAEDIVHCRGDAVDADDIDTGNAAIAIAAVTAAAVDPGAATSAICFGSQVDGDCACVEIIDDEFG